MKSVFLSIEFQSLIIFMNLLHFIIHIIFSFIKFDTNITQIFSQFTLICRGGVMRKIIITVKEVNDGEEANIDVTHSSNGKHSDLELETVKMLNEFLYMKVDEVSNSKNRRKLNESQIQQIEVVN